MVQVNIFVPPLRCPRERDRDYFPEFLRESLINPFPGLKPGVFPGLILSGAYYPDLKIGVLRRERIKRGAL